MADFCRISFCRLTVQHFDFWVPEFLGIIPIPSMSTLFPTLMSVHMVVTTVMISG